MEAALHARDRVGVQDFVLLEEYRSVTAFVDNLKKRFRENLIYTYIGPVLISVNPYKDLSIYNEKVIETYRNVNFYELPPHIYAIADVAYRSMRSEYRDQCVLISGESGAGKTEASKKILHYIAASSTHSKEVDRVKDRLLQSNPILEAFGNAKTNRNDNSSRFGKYMDVQFDFKGAPVGGIILNYLLEKSRVCHQSQGERNFHIFYQLLAGADSSMLKRFKLNRNVETYWYLYQGQSNHLETIDDKADFTVMQKALEVCDFSEKEQESLFSTVASILHLGNIVFDDNGTGQAEVRDNGLVQIMSKLLGCTSDSLMDALTNRSITVEGNRVTSPLSVEQATIARDAVAKGVYERLFKWLVDRINSSLATETANQKRTVLGLLDIYGFEIFEINSFEQFCINFCNEKLQQLFITLTLKSEQDEYLNEGIEWEPVSYFNNKIICDLVESKPVGLIAIMDEECLRPGTATDESFLDKMSKTLGGHPHFLSHMTADFPERKTIRRNEFRLLHYAGEVTYNCIGFLDKNNDLLFRDIKEVLSKTNNIVTSACFPKSELVSKKRPDTAATQFKNSLNQLMEILMCKDPSYIRCIKPNDDKRSNLFVDQIVRHQVKYLGLMENLRVRRAGFAYRRQYEHFLKRYKPLCEDTWPHYDGTAKAGVHTLCQHLGYEIDDFKMGKTKIFIRFPRVLFATEDALQQKKHDLATVIQAKYRCHRQRKHFRVMRSSATKIACIWKMYQAKKLLKKRRWAAQNIRKFIKGFTLRHQPLCEENRIFICQMRYNFLLRLKEQLPQSVLDKSWPDPPPLLTEASNVLHDLHTKNVVWSYCKKIPFEQRQQMEQKVLAEKLFRDRKANYPESIPEKFVSSRLDPHHEVVCNNSFKTSIKPDGEKIQYQTLVTKYDRKGYSARQRGLVITDQSIYVLNEKDFKLKEKITFKCLKGITVSSHADGIIILHTNTQLNGNKGDLILKSEQVIEVVVKIVEASGLDNSVDIVTGSVTHTMHNGKQGLVEFIDGTKCSVAKGKNGHLTVISPQIENIRL